MNIYSTVIPACTEDSRKLLLFTKNFSPGVIIQVHKKLCMCQALMLQWLMLLRNRRPGALFKLPNMLVLDYFRAHLRSWVRAALCDSNTVLVVIPNGMLSMCHPFDVVFNEPFKDCIHERYDKWLSEDNSKTPAGHLQCPGLAVVSEWVSSA